MTRKPPSGPDPNLLARTFDVHRGANKTDPANYLKHLYTNLNSQRIWGTQGKEHKCLTEMKSPLYNKSWRRWRLFNKLTRNVVGNKNVYGKKPESNKSIYGKKPETNKSAYGKRPESIRASHGTGRHSWKRIYECYERVVRPRTNVSIIPCNTHYTHICNALTDLIVGVLSTCGTPLIVIFKNLKAVILKGWPENHLQDTTQIFCQEHLASTMG